MKRIVFDIFILLSVFILPWWVSVSLAILGVFIFREFYEFLVTGIIIYLLYAIPGSRAIASPVWLPVILVLMYITTQIARRYIILYKNEI